jgi:Glycosyltransferase family 87
MLPHAVPTRRWSIVRLIVAAAVVALSAFGPSVALDWIPFQVAARMGPGGDWSSLYPASSARTLFDVSAAYREVAVETVQTDDGPSFSDQNLTAFVSPPPAAFALVPLRSLSWPESMKVWRLALALPVVLAMLWFARVSLVDASIFRRWSWTCLAGAPLIYYVVHTGQPSAWLFVAAAMSALPPTTPRDAVGGVFLGLGVLFKATPLVVLVGLWMAGRRRMAVVAAVLAAAGVLGSVGLAGWTPWGHFMAVNATVARAVVTDWNNAALDAALVRARVGADSLFYEPRWLERTVSSIVRIVLVLWAFHLARNPSRPPSRRSAAAWIAWMAATPILWLHYLSVLVPLFGSSRRPTRDPGPLVVLLLSGVFVAAVAGWRTGIQGYLLCLLWLASALWLLSNRDWRWRSLPS